MRKTRSFSAAKDLGFDETVTHYSTDSDSGMTEDSSFGDVDETIFNDPENYLNSLLIEKSTKNQTRDHRKRKSSHEGKEEEVEEEEREEDEEDPETCGSDVEEEMQELAAIERQMEVLKKMKAEISEKVDRRQQSLTNRKKQQKHRTKQSSAAQPVRERSETLRVQTGGGDRDIIGSNVEDGRESKGGEGGGEEEGEENRKGRGSFLKMKVSLPKKEERRKKREEEEESTATTREKEREGGSVIEDSSQSGWKDNLFEKIKMKKEELKEKKKKKEQEKEKEHCTEEVRKSATFTPGGVKVSLNPFPFFLFPLFLFLSSSFNKNETHIQYFLF